MKILLVEDDQLIGSAIKQALTDWSYIVNWVQNGEDAILAIKTEPYSLVLLDIGLPKKSGFDVLIQLRENHQIMPIIIITARDSVDDRVKGLDSGADDYLVKPFSLKELEARIRVMSRRMSGQPINILSAKNIQLNIETKGAIFNGETISLTAKEYSLFYELMSKPGTIKSREELEAKIYSWDEEIASNAIEFLIHGLRKKLHKDIIKNIRGLGWLVPKI
ncbi:MAG: two-component system OmpR family response regulator [Francisellaceae bacterium]|jgi:two-component system OmpR family response regulator